MRAPRPAILPVVLLLLALLGCNRASSPEKVLSETARNLGKIKSGEMHMIIEAGNSEEVLVSQELQGPFALALGNSLPLADIEYKTKQGSTETVTSFISTGDKVYVEVDGQAYELPDERTEELRGGGSIMQSDSLRLDEWITSAKMRSSPTQDVVTAKLDVVKALNGILEFARETGAVEFGSLPQLEGDSAKQVETATELAEMKVETGAKDRLLRSIDITFEFAAPTKELKETFGKLAEAKMRFYFEIEDHNSKFKVDEPSDPLPYSELEKRKAD